MNKSRNFLLCKLYKFFLWVCYGFVRVFRFTIRRIETKLASGTVDNPLCDDIELDPLSGKKKFLITSHSSFLNKYTTFGDTAAMKVVIGWMEDIGVDFDVACLSEHGFDGLDITKVNPLNYHTVVFVCGPWSKNTKDTKFGHFRNTRFIGIDVSVKTNDAHGLDVFFPRDYDGVHNPDLAFVSKTDYKPLVGVALVHDQREYGDKQRHKFVHDQISHFLESNSVAWIALDTLWKNNKTGIPDNLAFESLVSRLDAVITTRMHGLVYSIKKGVPALAIDPIAGGAKVSAQALALNWPLLIDSDDVNPQKIEEAVTRCLSGEMVPSVLHSQQHAEQCISKIEVEFKNAVLTLT